MSDYKILLCEQCAGLKAELSQADFDRKAWKAECFRIEALLREARDRVVELELEVKRWRSVEGTQNRCDPECVHCAAWRGRPAPSPASTLVAAFEKLEADTVTFERWCEVEMAARDAIAKGKP